jgi:hypothetical protein
MPGQSEPPPGPLDPNPEPDEVRAPTDQQVADEICRDLMEIHRESYGRSAARAQAHVLNDTVIVLIDGLQLFPNEAFLIDRACGGRSPGPQPIPEGHRAHLPRRGGASHRPAGDRLQQPRSHGGAPLHGRDLPPGAPLANGAKGARSVGAALARPRRRRRSW